MSKKQHAADSGMPVARGQCQADGAGHEELS